MDKIIYTKNNFHLGDNIFCCIVFCKIKDYIEQNNITINHYCESEHIVQINEFINSKNINILPLNDIPYNETVIDIWIGSPDYIYNIYTTNEEYDVFLCKFYNNILNKLNSIKQEEKNMSNKCFVLEFNEKDIQNCLIREFKDYKIDWLKHIKLFYSELNSFQNNIYI